MRNLTILAGTLLLASLSCHATTVATLENQLGGTINLTDENCTGDQGLLVYSRSPEGRVGVVGCWIYDGDFIMVKWNDGNVYSYPVDQVTITAKPK